MSATPPVTAEGWFSLHQVFSIDRRAMRDAPLSRITAARDSAVNMLSRLTTGEADAGGWSALVSLVGARGDFMLVHFRPTLDALGAVQGMVAREPLFDYCPQVYRFLSVTEAGFYHVATEAAKASKAAGGQPGDATYQAHVTERMRAEAASPHAQKRLYPPRPADMPYVSFYPMSKRRDPEQNWYALPIESRGEMMGAHGQTGRRYAGKILQIITGAIGLADWEWGVTLFAKDPLEFKRLVTDMRFDEVSAQYAEFGEFFVGKVVDPKEWAAGLT